MIEINVWLLVGLAFGVVYTMAKVNRHSKVLEVIVAYHSDQANNITNALQVALADMQKMEDQIDRLETQMEYMNDKENKTEVGSK